MSVTFFLVRHGEKIKEKSDASLETAKIISDIIGLDFKIDARLIEECSITQVMYDSSNFFLKDFAEVQHLT